MTKDSRDFKQLQRLILQIERDLLKQSRLKTILLNADTTLAGHRQDLRKVRARITRARATKKSKAR